MLLYMLGCALVEKAEEWVEESFDTGSDTAEEYACVGDEAGEFLEWSDEECLTTEQYVVSSWSFGCQDSVTTDAILQEVLGSQEPCTETLYSRLDTTPYGDTSSWVTSYQLEGGWVVQAEIPWEMFEDFQDANPGASLQEFSGQFYGFVYFNQ